MAQWHSRLEDESGEIWDWKNPSRFYEPWEKRRWDIQSHAYCWALGADKFNLAVFANGEYQHIPIERNEADLKAFIDLCWSIVPLITAEVEPWPMNWTGWHCSPKWCPVWQAGKCRGKHLAKETRIMVNVWLVIWGILDFRSSTWNYPTTKSPPQSVSTKNGDAKTPLEWSGESLMSPTAVNSKSDDHGVMQVNRFWADVFGKERWAQRYDYHANIEMGIHIWEAGGWKWWTCGRRLTIN